MSVGTRASDCRAARRARPGATIVLAAALLLAAAAALRGATLRPIPAIDASTMEPAVREQVEAAQRTLAAAPTLPAPEAARSFGGAGEVFLRYSLLDAAAPCFENAVALAPEDFRLAYYAGVAAQRGGELERARDHFLRAAELQSPFPAALWRLGEVELLRGDLEAAGRAFTAALAFSGWAPVAHYGLGRVALQRGDARAAAEHFEAVLAAQPEASIVHALLAKAYGRLGQLDKARAQAAAHGDRRVRCPDLLMHEVDAGNAGYQRRIVAAAQALKEGRFAEAAQGLRQALDVDAGDMMVWLNLGLAQERMSDFDGAAQSYRRAVEIDPESARARFDLGTLLVAHGGRREGIEQLQAAVRKAPELVNARFNLAAALAEEGRLAEALAQCDALLRIAPHDREALALRDRLRARPGEVPPPPPR
jgi:tetratricopeptide (TPR) repeat protein